MVTTAKAQVSVGIAMPGLSIGINVPVYPQLVRCRATRSTTRRSVKSNYFFYDGLYWVYQDDNWYASSWYNGPWRSSSRQAVPLFVLRVPVRYYRNPPTYFHGWRPDEPPRWGEHWGNDWERQPQRMGPVESRLRAGTRAAAGLPAPVLGRPLSAASSSSRRCRASNYRYQPRDAVCGSNTRRRRCKARSLPLRPPGPRRRNLRGDPPVAVTAQPQRPPQQVVAQPQRQPQQAVAQAPRPPQQQVVAQPQKQAPPQAVAQHAPPPKPQVQDKPQHKAPEPVAQHQAQPPPQAVAQHQQTQKPQGQGKPSQGNPNAQDPKHEQEKGGDKGEQHGQASGAKGIRTIASIS